MSKKEGGVPNLTIEEINNLVCNLVDLYETCSPFEICKKMGINILTLDLPNTVEGFFVNSAEVENKSYVSILINNSVPENKREKVCAHELGHVILHRNINSEKYSNDHNINLESFEFEAEMFSMILLSKNQK